MFAAVNFEIFSFQVSFDEVGAFDSNSDSLFWLQLLKKSNLKFCILLTETNKLSKAISGYLNFSLLTQEKMDISR